MFQKGLVDFIVLGGTQRDRVTGISSADWEIPGYPVLRLLTVVGFLCTLSHL